jgi:hypothetical protein
VVDEDTRLPITLWEGRDAETLRDWLLEHPGVQIACRDGSPIYRQGITSGAPDAIQVSDRFHLWQGLSRRVQQIAAVHRGCLAAAAPEPDPRAAADAEPEATDSPVDSPAADHAQRLFEAVHTLTDTGRAYNAVARELGLNWRTLATVGAAAGTLLIGAFRGADPAAQGLVIDTEFTADVAQRAARRPDQLDRVATGILGKL